MALIDFFGSIDVLLLILVRFIGFFMLLPVFSGTSVPNQTKIAMAFFMSYIIFTSGVVTEIIYEPSTFGYFYLLIIEFMTGFIMAFAVYIVFTTFFVAGQIMDFQIGFSMVNVLDPVSQIQVPVTGNLIYLMTLLFLVQTGNLNEIIRVFADGFEILPIGGAAVLGNHALLEVGIDIMANFFVIGLRIAMPVLGVIMILDIVLGILVKAVPQMNIFVVGMPIKTFVGIVIFFLVVPGFYNIYDVVFGEAMENIQAFTEVLQP